MLPSPLLDSGVPVVGALTTHRRWTQTRLGQAASPRSPVSCPSSESRSGCSGETWVTACTHGTGLKRMTSILKRALARRPFKNSLLQRGDTRVPPLHSPRGLAGGLLSQPHTQSRRKALSEGCSCVPQRMRTLLGSFGSVTLTTKTPLPSPDRV